jgi:hypothetical protein
VDSLFPIRSESYSRDSYRSRIDSNRPKLERVRGRQHFDCRPQRQPANVKVHRARASPVKETIDLRCAGSGATASSAAKRVLSNGLDNLAYRRRLKRILFNEYSRNMAVRREYADEVVLHHERERFTRF